MSREKPPQRLERGGDNIQELLPIRVGFGHELEAALRREVAEETGFASCDIRFVCTQKFNFIRKAAFWSARPIYGRL